MTGLLPALRRGPLTHKDDVPADKLKAVMKKYGGFVLENEKVDLRFPTVDAMPKGYWSIVHCVGTIE